MEGRHRFSRGESGRKKIIPAPFFDDGDWPDMILDIEQCANTQKHRGHIWNRISKNNAVIELWCDGNMSARPSRIRHPFPRSI